MSILSDQDIRKLIKSGAIKIRPHGDKYTQPAGVDFHLGDSILEFPSRNIRLSTRQKYEGHHKINLDKEHPYIIDPGTFILANTLEWLEIPDDIVCKVEGRSGIGRLGLAIHTTAGYVDPGWKGVLTLELYNVNKLPIEIYAGDRIGQFTFYQMSSKAEKPYGSEGFGSKYQLSMDVVGSKIDEDAR